MQADTTTMAPRTRSQCSVHFYLTDGTFLNIPPSGILRTPSQDYLITRHHPSSPAFTIKIATVANESHSLMTQCRNTSTPLLMTLFSRLYGLWLYANLFLKRRWHRSKGFPLTQNISLGASSRDIISGQRTSSVKMGRHLSAQNNVTFLQVSSGIRLVERVVQRRLSLAASRLTKEGMQ